MSLTVVFYIPEDSHIVGRVNCVCRLISYISCAFVGTTIIYVERLGLFIYDSRLCWAYFDC